MATVYKSKKGIMPLGLIAIALAVSIAGCLLSFVYLKLNKAIPNIYLCLICAFGFGAAMGGIALLLIKFMKIRSKNTALVGVIIGCLVFTVFKWALYVQWDNETFIKNSPMAWEYCEFYFDFTDEDGEPMSEDVLAEEIEYLKSITAAEYMGLYYEGGVSAYIKNIKEYNGRTVTTDQLKNTSSFDYFYEDFVIKGKEAESILKSYDMKTADFLKYVGTYPDVKYLLTHPAEFIDNIKVINGYGRWSIGRKAKLDNGENNNMKGLLLWLVWLGEIFVICVPAVIIACGKAEKPFIESENKWATELDNDGFMLAAPINHLVAANAFMANPDSIFTHQHLPARPGLAPYMKLKLYHSSNYEENYVSLVTYTYDQKNKKHNEKIIAKYVAVSKDFLGRFYAHCGMMTPFEYHAEFTAPEMPAVTPEINPMDIFSASIDEIKQMSTTPSGMMDEISPAMADEKSQEDVINELNS